MSNLPVVTLGNSAPTVPADVLAGFAEMFNRTAQGFGTNFRRIRVGKTQFTLDNGQSKEIVPADRLFAVLVGVAEFNHCVWYERDYMPGQEPEAPDLVWVQRTNTDADYPAALPVQFRTKQMVNGAERWKYTILRRTVWAVIRTDINGQMILDVDNPYVLDLTSMSLFGKGIPEQNMYKWSGLIDLCRSYSSTNATITPSMFVTQLILDPNVSVNGVVNFRPSRDANGMMSLLDTNTLMRVFDCMRSDKVAELLKVREKHEYGDTPAATQPVYQQPAPQPAPAPAPQPVYQQPAPQPAPAPAPQPVYQQPAPQPAPAPAPAPQPAAPATSMDSLLAEAAAVLNGEPTNPVAQPAPSAPETLQPVAQPVSVVPEAPQPTASDAVLQNSVDNLLAQLG